MTYVSHVVALWGRSGAAGGRERGGRGSGGGAGGQCGRGARRRARHRPSRGRRRAVQPAQVRAYLAFHSRPAQGRGTLPCQRPLLALRASLRSLPPSSAWPLLLHPALAARATSPFPRRAWRLRARAPTPRPCPRSRRCLAHSRWRRGADRVGQLVRAAMGTEAQPVSERVIGTGLSGVRVPCGLPQAVAAVAEAALERAGGASTQASRGSLPLPCIAPADCHPALF
jgi:hypothetical protein